MDTVVPEPLFTCFVSMAKVWYSWAFWTRALLGSVSPAVMSLSICCVFLNTRSYFLADFCPRELYLWPIRVSSGHIFSELFRLLCSGWEISEHFGGLSSKLCVPPASFYWSLSEIMRSLDTFGICVWGRISQPEHYEHLGLENSLLWKAL